MRKRLRKKLRRGEFTEYAFDVEYSLLEGLSPTAAEEFLDRFLEHAIEAQDLSCGGGGQGMAWDFLATKAGRGSPNDEQRRAVGAWLAAQSEVRSYTVGQFVDAWHGPEDTPATGPPTIVQGGA